MLKYPRYPVPSALAAQKLLPASSGIYLAFNWRAAPAMAAKLVRGLCIPGNRHHLGGEAL